jgi:uncharacterized protein YjbJ (UPF0337 family)
MEDLNQFANGAFTVLAGTRARCNVSATREETDMNWDQVEAKWQQFKGSVKQKWGKLTDDGLDVIAGKRDQLVGKIQERYGITKEEAHKQIDDWRPGVPTVSGAEPSRERKVS